MANQGPELPRLEGGGTSQAARRLAALDPDFVRVDERTPRDLAEFARQYARELHYFDLANQRAGSWDRFLDPALDLDELTALLNGDPEQAIPAGAGPRPHVALFLTFLKLLQHAQGDVNALTRRHLDFYYRTVLGLQKGEPSADRVNVLFEPAAGVGQVVVPKGALLDGGPDSTDTRQVYRTDRDIVVGRERVGQLAAVYVDKRVTGIREARERHTGTNEEAYLRMFETALGDPAPGDRLRNYPTGVAVDFVLLKKLGDAVRFCRTTTGLALELFELRALIRFLRRRVAGAEWVRVNRALQRVGRTRDPAFVLTPADRDFDANLARALGAAPNFDGITLVETIDDVYEQRHRGRVRTFITTDLRFSSVAAFEQMMRLKFTVDNEWTEVNRLLEIAGGRRRQASDYTLATRSPSAFEENLAEALPGLTFPNGAADIDAYYVDIVRLETFFFMSAEDFGFVMSLFGRTPPPIEVEWLRAYAGLAAAHGQQVYATRRMQLDAVRRGARARPPIDRLDAVFHFPLGETVENGESAPLTRLEPFVSNDDDKDFLVGVQATVEERPRASVPWDKVIRIVERAQRQRAVGPPHDVGRRGDDRPVVKLWIALAAAVRRQQPVCAHHAQDPGPGDADPVQDPQPCVHLPMALALERRPGEVGANGRQELLSRESGLRTSSGQARAPLPARRPRPPSVERRSRVLPRRHTRWIPYRRPVAAEVVVLIAATSASAKGGVAPRRGARSRSSSLSIDSSPMCRLATSSATAAGSPACSFNPTSRPAKARSFHSSRR